MTIGCYPYSLSKYLLNKYSNGITNPTLEFQLELDL